MADKVYTGLINYVAGGRALTHKIPVRSTIGFIICRLTGDLVVTQEVTLTEDDILRLVRRIEMDIGGVRIKSIGDGNAISSAFVTKHWMNLFEYGYLPEHTAPAVAVGTNSFSATIRIPFEMPPAFSGSYPQQNTDDGVVSFNTRKASCISPTDKDINMNVEWGVAADVFSAGAATLDDVELEVIAVCYPEIDSVQMPFILHETSKQAELEAGANARDMTELDRLGIVPGIGILAWDDTCRDSAVWNRLQFIVNSNAYKIDESWGGLFEDARAFASLQQMVGAGGADPEGVNFALFDAEENSEGSLILDAGDVKDFVLNVDHAALTETYRILLHTYHLQKQG